MSNKTTNEKEIVHYEKRDLDIFIDETKIETRRLKFSIEQQQGTHSELTISFYILDGKEDMYHAFMMSKDLPNIKIVAKRKDKTKNIMEKVIFNGPLTRIEVREDSRREVSINITAMGNPVAMSMIEKYRSFQNPQLTYKEIIETIMSGEEYKQLKTPIEYKISEDLNVATNKPYIQYGESDWSFLKRILSDLNLPIFSHVSEVLFGFSSPQEDETNLLKSRFGRIRYGRNVMFKIEGRDIYGIGEKVSFKMKDGSKASMIVMGSTIFLLDGVLACTFILGYQDGSYMIGQIEHNQIAGRSIEGRVTKVTEKDGIAVMGVDFSEGLIKSTTVKKGARPYKDEYAGTFLYPYTTAYSKTNSGFFVTPETNDKVSIYFPNGEDSFAYIQGAVNNEGNGRFSNPNVRNYTLGGDKEAGNKPMFNFQLDSRKFDVNVTDYISLVARNSTRLEAQDGSTSVSGKKGTQVISSDSTVDVIGKAGVSVTSEEVVVVKGDNVTSVGEGGGISSITLVKGNEIEIN